MKKIFLFTFLVCSGYCFSQIINFPDPSFKYALTHSFYPNYSNYDTNHDGEIDMQEALGIVNLTVGGQVIDDVTGIRNFVNLQNFKADNCAVVHYDLHDMPNLKTFSCKYNYNLTETIDVSNCPNLTSINCSANFINAINLTGSHALQSFIANGHRFQHLDLSAQTQLASIDLSNGPLMSLDLTGITTLQYIYAYNNQMASLVAPNNPALKYVNCSSNFITTLDLSGATGLLTLDCARNRIENIKLDGTINVRNLDCSRNKIKTLDLRHMKNIYNLRCDENQLEKLDISGWGAVTGTNYRMVDCSKNKLKSLLVNDSEINYLTCGNNDFERLDMSNRSRLISLKCPNAPYLTYLNMTGNDTSPILDETDYRYIDLSGNYNLFFICADSWQVGKYEDYVQHIGLDTKVSDNCDILPIITPNPTKDYVIVNGTEKITSMFLYDLQGNLLQQYEGAGVTAPVIDLSPYVTGIYIIKITTASGNGNTIKKIVKR
jgi:Leucine-rich repeat (LRR) protein